MLIIDKIILLSNTEMFKYTPDENLSLIAQETELKFYQAGDDIVIEGEVGDRLYIIVSGKCEVIKNNHLLAHLKNRDVFGDLAVLDEEPRMATVRAETDCDVLELNKESLLSILEVNPSIYQGIVKFLCKRMRNIEQMGKVIIPNPSEL